MERGIRKSRKSVVALTIIVMSSQVQADVINALLGEPRLDFSYGGFIRNENAISITSEENPNNQRGNLFNGKPVERRGSFVALPETFQDTVVRPVPQSDTTINLEYVRGELQSTLTLFDNLKFNMTARALYDPNIYNDQFNLDDTRTANPVGTLNRNKANQFEYRYDSGRVLAATAENPSEPQDRSNDAFEARQVAKLQAEEGSSPLEWASDDYMLDFPRLYLDYQNGPLLVRIGNQQIAWGDLIFFRLLDVANGLDLRRHQILDFAFEEFSDKRIPSLGVRTSYRLPLRGVTNGVMGDWEVDAYVQRFRASIFPNPNTTYNVIPAQFTVHDEFDRFDNEFNYGVKLRGAFGPVDLQLMANRRYNHWGVFQWTDADVVRGLEPQGPAGIGALGAPFEGLFGGQLADGNLEVDPTGVTSAKEFRTYAALARLDHHAATNAFLENFPALQEIGGQPTSDPAEQEQQQDFFFQLSGGLRGHITREYYRENNFGFGIGYKFIGPSDSIIFDEFDIDFEVKYTPDRKFTPLNLSPIDSEIIEEDEYEIGLTLQKFLRYSATFPSAITIFQYLHRSESDIFNRHLSGFGADPNKDKPEDRLPTGRSSFDAIVLAVQQPGPNRIFRFDFAALYDVKGGLLLQPSFRWKYNRAITLQIFANYIDTISGNPTENALSTVDFADEVTTRIEYQF